MESLTQQAGYVNAALPEYVSGTGEVLRDISSSGRVNPWSEYKAASLDLASLYTEALAFDKGLISEARLMDLKSCANYLEFAELNGVWRLHRANFCRNRHCPICTSRRQKKLFAQMTKAVPYIHEVEPAARYVLLTLTTKNVPLSPVADVLQGTDSLSVALDELRDGCRLLLSAKVPKDATPALSNFRTCLLGFMRAIEITYRRERNEFHHHAHILLALKPEYFSGCCYVSQYQWRQLWRWIMRLDYEPRVDVRTVDLNKSSLAEVCKYPLKPVDFNKIPSRRCAINVLINLHHACSKRRFVTFGGIFKKARQVLRLDDIAKGDLVNLAGKTVEPAGLTHYLYHYDTRSGDYVC